MHVKVYDPEEKPETTAVLALRSNVDGGVDVEVVDEFGGTICCLLRVDNKGIALYGEVPEYLGLPVNHMGHVDVHRDK